MYVLRTVPWSLPVTINTLTLEHTEVYLFKDTFTFLRGKKKTLATATQANSLRTQTGTLNFDLDRQAGLHGFMDWIVVQGWGRALLYWVTIFAQFSFFTCYYVAVVNSSQESVHPSISIQNTYILRNTLYTGYRTSNKLQEIKKWRKGNVIISRVVLETVKS